MTHSIANSLGKQQLMWWNI